MCGIGGVVLARECTDEQARARLGAALDRLCDGLRHRGPDARGTFVSARAGLAHARLSIIDLSPTGAQPMRSPDGRLVLAFNGEIYNFRELRRELEARGERFAGSSDSEVALRLLALDGPDALARLDGMFALALLDVARGEVLLARDRIGQKPLYWAPLAGGGFAFASELRPLLGEPGVDTGLCREGLAHYLGFGFCPAPWTLRRGIRQLLPGMRLSLRPGAAAESVPFVPAPGPREPRLAGDLASLSGELECVLSDAVRAHLVADVPVGVLLSGGVDSSTIAALAARHAGRVKTFSVVHDDPRYDERDAARAVAQAIESEHHEVRLRSGGLTREELDAVVDHHGDPFADSSSLNVLRLAQAVREHVTVALSGDGGDEVFAGYPRFAQLRWLSRLAGAPAPLLRAGASLLAAVPGGRARPAARALRIAEMPRARRAVAFASLFWPAEQRELLCPEWLLPDGDAALDGLLGARGVELEPDPVASAHWLEQRLILPDDMLTKIDRMSMAHALEVRPPLLGNSVLDFAARLPFAAKNAGTSGKRVLRALARRLVPPWVIDRPKRGFALPLVEYGGAVLEEATRFALDAPESPLRALCRPEALGRLSHELRHAGPGRDPEDSAYRRVHRRWALVLLAHALARQGGSL